MKKTSHGRLNIKHIAKLTGVAASTVSRALNNHPDVNAETRARVLAVIEELEYSPNPMARGLKTHRSYTAGLAVRSFADTWVMQCVPPIEETLRLAGYEVFVSSHNLQPEQEKHVLRSFWNRHVDGIIIASSTLAGWLTGEQPEDRPPLVLMNPTTGVSYPHLVQSDVESGTRLATEYLIRLGHTRIAHLSIDPELMPGRLRLPGYRAALEAAGLPYEAGLVIQTETDEAGGSVAMERLMSLVDPPTAVFCFNDLMAIGALRCVLAHGLRVPQDLSIMGFDDILLGRYITPKLTTIHQPMEDMGRQAAQMLLDLMEDREAPGPVILPVELVERESTGAAPRHHT